MQGTPYIYQGEEIGMINPEFTRLEQYRDVESINAAKTLLEQDFTDDEIIAILQAKSRDNARTPMQWSDAPQSGFTTGLPWIELAANYLDLNAAQAISDPNSIYYYYRKLNQLRKSYPVIINGEYKIYLPDDQHLYVYTRSLSGETILVINNFYATTYEFIEPVELQKYELCEYLINNYLQPPKDWRKFIMQPYQSVVLYLKVAL